MPEKDIGEIGRHIEILEDDFPRPEKWAGKPSPVIRFPTFVIL